MSASSTNNNTSINASSNPTLPSPADKDMIVKKPKEDDVLLGQGYYRHTGNQRLNKIVDAKVDEYKSQSRPFKTYMVHEIIQRMRNDGIRFLKELAHPSKGWVVVQDDKEAREKVAQRFQYMMRKQQQQSEAKAAVAASKKMAASSEGMPSLQPHLNWNGNTVKVPFLPVFHQLQKTSVVVDDDINKISLRLSECFHILDIRDRFDYEESNAVLLVPENLTMQMNLWKPLGGNRGVIVELINLKGDLLVFQKYSRYVLEAATGFFDKYKHTLFKSGATATVQDHLTTIKTTWVATKTSSLETEGGRPQSPGAMSVKPGMVKALSDRGLQDGKKKKDGTFSAEKKDDYGGSSSGGLVVKRPSVKRLEQQPPSKPVPLPPREQPPRPVSLMPPRDQPPKFVSVMPHREQPSKPVQFPPREEPRFVPLAPKSVAPKPLPAPKLVPSAVASSKLAPTAAPKESSSRKDPNVAAETDALTGCFASAFSRWESGIDSSSWRATNTSGVTNNQTATTTNAQRPSPPAVKQTKSMAPQAWVSSTEGTPGMVVSAQPDLKQGIYNGVGQPSSGPPAPSPRTGQGTAATASSALSSRTSVSHQVIPPVESHKSSSSSKTDAMPNGVPSSNRIQDAQETICATGVVLPQVDRLASGTDRQPESPQEVLEPIRRLSLSGNANSKGEAVADERLCSGHALDKWTTALPSEEMKCDSSVDEKLDTEMASIDRTVESMKRLSISSNDASYCDTRPGRDSNEYPMGFWPGPLSNQEMKCDSSLDDEPHHDSNLSSRQSFLPSSFFGATAPNAYATNIRAPNPPSPANSLCSHISVEMRSIPSPSPSPPLSANISVEVFSLPSPCGSFNSRCSLAMNSLKHARVDEALSPSMFQSEQPRVNGTEPGKLGELGQPEDPQHLSDGPLSVVPPTIFFESSSSSLTGTPS